MTDKLFGERKKVVLFDLNGTLLRPKRTFKACFLEVFEEMAGRWEPGTARPESARIYEAYMTEWRRRVKKRGVPRGEQAWRLRRSCLEHALSDLTNVTPNFVRIYFQEVKNRYISQAQGADGTQEMLERLGKRYRIAVLSNGSRRQALEKLRAAGLDRHFPAERIFACRGRLTRKPNKSAFDKAVRRLGATRKEAVMVGDSWRTDIAGALAYGMDAVWIRPAAGRRMVQRRDGKTLLILPKVSALPDVL